MGGGRRSLHGGDLCNLFCSPNIVSVIKSRTMRWISLVARIKEGRSASTILTGKPTGKRPSGRPWRRWEDNIRMDIKEIGINARNWVIQFRIAIIVNALNIRIP